MTTALNIAFFVLPVLAALIAAILGAAEVRKLRNKTGDTSLLTSILGGTFFHHKARY